MSTAPAPDAEAAQPLLAPAAAVPAALPVLAGGARLPALDVARGLALLGVALVNVLVFAYGWDSYHLLDRAAHAGDVAAEYLVGLVFTGRSYPLLAFLFGLGLALQAARGDGRARLRARLKALLLLGLLHGLLLWPGDVVAVYALIGLLLTWVWPLSDRALRRWLVGSAAFALLMNGLGALGLVWELSESMARSPAPPYALAEVRAVWAAMPGQWLSYGLGQALLPQVWLMVALGLWAGRSGALVSWLMRGAPLERWLLWPGIGVVAGNLLDLWASAHGGWSASTSPATAAWYFGSVLAGVSMVPWWLLVAQRWGETKHAATLRAWVIAAGRTPLTQFFGQSLLFFVLCSPLGLGLHGQVGRASVSLLALAVWLLLALFGHRWLARGHARGPVEALSAWLTRAITGPARPD